MDWAIEARMRERFHLTTQDLEDMDVEKYYFWMALVEAENSELAKQQKKLEQQMKAKR